MGDSAGAAGGGDSLGARAAPGRAASSHGGADVALWGRWSCVRPAIAARSGCRRVTIWAVHVVEEYPPAGVEPLEWLLLTTCAVPSSIEAQECVEWYACRFGIEVWHKVLKSGCRIEARQLESAARLQRCLTLFSVIAWRIVYAAMLSRTLPELPCTVLLAVGGVASPVLCNSSHADAPSHATDVARSRAVDCPLGRVSRTARGW